MVLSNIVRLCKLRIVSSDRCNFFHRFVSWVNMKLYKNYSSHLTKTNHGVDFLPFPEKHISIPHRVTIASYYSNSSASSVQIIPLIVKTSRSAFRYVPGAPNSGNVIRIAAISRQHIPVNATSTATPL